MRKKLRTTQKIYLAVKSIIDPILAAILLLVISPVIFLIALKIKQDSPGPVFAYNHLRIGKNQKLFEMYKFRTMKFGYEKITPSKSYKEHMYKMNKDPRITNFGLFLRKIDLDELPQLLNIIKGEMFFIGPRCFQPEEEKYYKKLFPSLREDINFRTKIKPGVTGLWQVSGRNTTTLKKRLELDSNYIENVSPLLDLHILFKTAKNFLRQKWQ